MSIVQNELVRRVLTICLVRPSLFHDTTRVSRIMPLVREGRGQLTFWLAQSGQSGRMRMFLWDLTNPERDGALENDIVVHENTHGISNRMTGGGTGRYAKAQLLGW